MSEAITKNKVTLSPKEYQELKAAYQKIGEILLASQKKKISSELKTLQGIWTGTKINDEDIAAAKKSLFKSPV